MPLSHLKFNLPALQRPVLAVFLAGLVYFLIALTCIRISIEENIAQIWFSNAVMLVIIYRTNHALRWWYFMAGMIANVFANVLAGNSLPIALGLAFSNGIEMLPAVLLLEWYKTTPGMPIIIATLIASSLLSGFTASAMFTYNSGNEYLIESLNWFTTDFLSILMLMPVGLSYTHHAARTLLLTKKVFELLFGVIATGATVILSLMYARSPFLLIALALLPASFRLGLFGSTVLCATSTLTYIILSAQNTFEPYLYTLDELRSYGYFFMSISLIPTIIIAYLVEQRENYEKIIQESEQKFRGALEYAGMGIAIVKPDGHWATINRSLCEMLDYTETELLKMSFKDITHPDDLPQSLAMVDKIVNGELKSAQFEKRYVRKNGETFWGSVVLSGIYDNDEKLCYFIAHVENIDRRKHIEKALQDSEQRWKFALEGGIQGVWDWNAETDKVYFSHTWKRMLGYDDEEIGDNLSEWTSRVHPDDLDETMKKINDHLTGKTDTYTSEHRLKCKDGHYKWVLDRGKIISTQPDGKPLRLIGTHTDIDTLKNAENEREQLTQRLKLAIDSGKIGVFELDLKTGVLTWDERMAELYDLNPEEAHERESDWAKHVHPKDLDRVNAEFARTANDGTPFDTEFRIFTRMRQVRYIHAKALPVRNKQNEIVSVLGINWDVTNERALTNALYEEKERLDITLRSIGDAVFVTDEMGLITFTSTIAQQLFGISNDQMMEKRLDAICNLTEDNTVEKPIYPINECLVSNKIMKSIEPVKLKISSHRSYYVQYTATPLRSAAGDIIGCVLVIQDVTRTQNLQRELAHQATHDELTGLINRREFEERLSQHLKDERNTKGEHVIAFLDLDRFKIVNDTAGHTAGDELLKKIADILTKATRSTDIVARIGGDEFAIILPNCSIAKAHVVAENLIKTVKNYRFHWEDKIYEIGVSVGLVAFKPKQIELEPLLSHADTACYEAKHLGGDGISVYVENDDATAKLQAEVTMVPRINDALEKNQFSLYAREIKPTQPTTDEKRTHEILLRMQDHGNRLIMPSQFMKIAERHHLMTSIDEWVLHQLLMVRAKQFHAHPDIAISINLSHQSIHAPTFLEHLTRLLESTLVKTSNIGFELTERALQENLDSTLAFLNLLERTGCFVSLDDFGSGLSSFNYLKNFPMKFVKIDAQFIRHIDQSDADRIIVESINSLAHRLEAKTIAEYVETPAILNVVREMKIDYMQGDAVAPEVPLDTIFSNETTAK